MRPMSTIAAFAIALGGCKGCNAGPSSGDADASAPSASTSVTAEPLPRCLRGNERLTIPGENVVVGDVAVSPAGILLGIVRRDGGRAVASVVRTPVDLSTSKVVDLGVALGDDPAPSPRWNGRDAYVATVRRRANDAGVGGLREVQVARIDEAGASTPIASVVQQADESTAFDVAWPENGGDALVAWDEDAPASRAKDAAAPDAVGDAAVTAIRGFVKVQSLAPGAKARVASPESSDAEAPRLLARPSGFWLAWLARRAEDDPGPSPEGPGERRAFRWVELVSLDAKGELTSSVRRVSPEKGRAVSFELARGEGDDVVVLVQDEAARADGSGARLVRYALRGDRVESGDVIDGGVGHSLAELLAVSSEPSERLAGGPRWLAWNDTNERLHLTPLGASLAAWGPDTAEPVLDNARVLAATPPDRVYALVHSDAASKGDGEPVERSRNATTELRRFTCALSASVGPATVPSGTGR